MKIVYCILLFCVSTAIAQVQPAIRVPSCTVIEQNITNRKDAPRQSNPEKDSLFKTEDNVATCPRSLIYNKKNGGKFLLDLNEFSVDNYCLYSVQTNTYDPERKKAKVNVQDLTIVCESEALKDLEVYNNK